VLQRFQKEEGQEEERQHFDTVDGCVEKDINKKLHGTPLQMNNPKYEQP
jgi:hypothetical protein